MPATRPWRRLTVRWRSVRTITAATRPVIAGEIVVVVVLLFVYDQIRALAPTRAGQALHAGQRILDVETAHSLDIERWSNALLANHRGWETLASWYYQAAHVSVTLLTLGFLWWWHPHVYRGARNALVGINVVGLVIFWMDPVAPPRLLHGAGFVDSGLVTGMAEAASTVTPNQFASMPSLHVAWAVWVAAQLSRTVPWRPMKWAAYLYPILTSIVVIATGNHFVVDVVAGGALAIILVRWGPQLTTRPWTAIRFESARFRGPLSPATVARDRRVASLEETPTAEPRRMQSVSIADDLPVSR